MIFAQWNYSCRSGESLNSKQWGEEPRPDQTWPERRGEGDQSEMKMKMKACFLAEIPGYRCVVFTKMPLLWHLLWSRCSLWKNADLLKPIQRRRWILLHLSFSLAVRTLHKRGKKSFCCGCLPGQGWISLGKKCPPPSGKKWKSFKNSRTLKLADSAALEVSQRRFHSSHLHFHLQYLFKISLHV